MNHCQRCGHPLSSHDQEGNCQHGVSYGNSTCACSNYLKAESDLPTLLAKALYEAPGRDSEGTFYSASQARLVGRFAEALLSSISPTRTIDAIELCEGWRDARPVDCQRWFTLTTDENSNHEARLYQSGPGRGSWLHTSVSSLRDAAAKAIMKAGNDGAGS